eukprot:sb/3461213/
MTMRKKGGTRLLAANDLSAPTIMNGSVRRCSKDGICSVYRGRKECRFPLSTASPGYRSTSYNLLRDLKVVGEGEEETQENEELLEKEEEVRRKILGTVRYLLLPLKYLEGLSGDITMRLCEEEIKAAIHWRKLPPNGRKSSPVWRHGMFGGKIYVAGGAGASLAELSNPRLKLEMFDSVHGEWALQTEPDFMSSEPHVGCLASVGGYLYVIGGTDASGQPGKLVHRLHISTGVWETVPSLRSATTKAGVCTLDGQIFVGGGWNGSDLQCSFEKFDPTTMIWQKCRNMNRNRMEFPMVECGGLLYSICGNTADFSNLAQSLEVYDPVANGWTELQPTIRPRWCPGAAVVKDFIFICGLPGTDRASLRESDKIYTVERFSPATGQWSIMPALSNPVGGASLVAVANTLYVLGGSDGSAPLAACSIAQRYDVEAENWQSLAPMTMKRVGASTAEVRRKILETVRYLLLPLKYLEGLSGDITMRLCEEEIKAAIHWRKLPPNGRKSSPVWRHGMFGGKIYVAGGAGASLAELSNPRLKLEMFDSVHGEWALQTEPDFMSSEPHVGCLASVGGYLYVIGGTDASGQPGKLVHRLHISTGVWEKVPSLRSATTKAGVCTLDGQIFVGGGWNGSDLHCSFEKFDPTTMIWQKCRNMNRNRMEFPMVECGGLLYSICGNTADFSNLAQSLEVYDPVANGWTELQPTIRPRWSERENRDTRPSGHSNLLRDLKVVGEGEEETQENEELLEKEEEVRRKILGTVRYLLLPLKYLEGLSGDITMRLCEEEIKAAIHWRKLPPNGRKSSPVWRHGMFGGKIYVAGGAGASLAELSNPRLKLEMFDSVHGEWALQTEPDFMSSEPHVGCLASVGGYLYVIGGTDASGQPGKLVHRLHISTGVWEKVPSLRSATTKAGVCTLDGQIFVGGGWNGSDLHCSFEKFDPTTMIWQKCRNMNRNRMEFPMVECGGLLYSICGNTADFSNLAQSLEVYDPVANGWTELQPTIRPRWCPGAAVVKDFIFICGLPGTDRASLRESDKIYTVERFSPATGQWSIMPALSNPVGGASLVAVANTLYVLGGSDGSAPLAACSIAQRYDVEAENWQSLAPMTMKRVGASTAESCGAWAAEGFCDAHRDLMSLYCPATCGVCNKVAEGSEVFTEIIETVAETTGQEYEAENEGEPYEPYEETWGNEGEYETYEETYEPYEEKYEPYDQNMKFNDLILSTFFWVKPNACKDPK